MATAHALAPQSSYWEQFYAALTCAGGDESAAWMEAEIERYRSQFKLDEGEAWRTIACNLSFFAGYYGTAAVMKMRKNFGAFPECFDAPDFRQEKRKCLGMSGRAAKDSPV
jgi:hypothetical protein